MTSKKESKSKVVAVIPKNEAAITSIKAEALISLAIRQGTPVETMEKLLNMRRELKAEFAKEEYDRAMADFQSECPVIRKTREVRTKSGIVAYRFAPIDEIFSQTRDLLQKYGFSYAIQTVLSTQGVKSTCIVKHSAGHSESYEMEVPLGNKTDIMSNSQVVAAASTFSKRYAFCNAFGILTADEDSDGSSGKTDKDNKPKGKEMSPEEKFEKVKLMLKGLKTKKQIKQALDKVEESAYTEQQKNELRGFLIDMDSRL